MLTDDADWLVKPCADDAEKKVAQNARIITQAIVNLENDGVLSVKLTLTKNGRNARGKQQYVSKINMLPAYSLSSYRPLARWLEAWYP